MYKRQKQNRAIYQLMVLALRAELQNILTSIKFSQLDKCLASLNEMTAKFLKIASDGNQAIAPTLNNFISEIHDLFESSIKEMCIRDRPCSLPARGGAQSAGF